MKKCGICNQPLNGMGNNSMPFRYHGRCCDSCNENVILPMRIFMLGDAQQALKIETDGHITTIKPKDEKFTLEEMQEAVGGYIEVYPKASSIYGIDKFVFLVDEEGYLKHLSHNTLAFELFNLNCVGTLLVIPKRLFDDN